MSSFTSKAILELVSRFVPVVCHAKRVLFNRQRKELLNE